MHVWSRNCNSVVQNQKLISDPLVVNFSYRLSGCLSLLLKLSSPSDFVWLSRHKVVLKPETSIRVCVVSY